MAKRRVRNDHDNIDDYFDADVLPAMADGLTIGPEGGTPQGRAVAAFMSG